MKEIKENENKIIKIRGKQVMLDRDAAMLYGVELKNLIKIVNKKWFLNN